MNTKWTVRVTATLLGLAMLASTAMAAHLNVAISGQGNSSGCDGLCQGTLGDTITDTRGDAYPAYQPLEVCDDVCIFY